MNMNRLQKAKDSLTIIDAYMISTKAHCADLFDPKRYSLEDISYQLKHVVTGSHKEVFEEGKLDGHAIFKVLIDVGCRFVPKSEADEGKEDPSTLAEIEATMVAEYVMTDTSLDDDSLKAFALNNASYHIWPFWREYLMSMCNRMNLPKIAVPTFQVKNNT